MKRIPLSNLWIGVTSSAAKFNDPAVLNALVPILRQNLDRMLELNIVKDHHTKALSIMIDIVLHFAQMAHESRIFLESVICWCPVPGVVP